MNNLGGCFLTWGLLILLNQILNIPFAMTISCAYICCAESKLVSTSAPGCVVVHVCSEKSQQGTFIMALIWFIVRCMLMYCLRGAYFSTKRRKFIYFAFWKRLRMIKHLNTDICSINSTHTLTSKHYMILMLRTGGMSVVACSNRVCGEAG